MAMGIGQSRAMGIGYGHGSRMELSSADKGTDPARVPSQEHTSPIMRSPKFLVPLLDVVWLATVFVPVNVLPFHEQPFLTLSHVVPGKHFCV